MGSATTGALAAVRSVLAEQGSKAGLAAAEDLFAASEILANSAQLRAVVVDPSADPEGKAALVRRVFSGKLSDVAVTLLAAAASQRWSRQRDILAAIEELGIRAIAQSEPKGVDISAELFVFGTAVNSDDELELALRSKLASPSAKVALVDQLLVGKASEQTEAIVRQLVRQPRGRSIREALRETAKIVADQAGLSVATVVSATPIPVAQLERLEASLAKKYGRRLKLNLVIDQSVIGGVRVQVGDDVIDGSIASRINELRLQLVG